MGLRAFGFLLCAAFAAVAAASEPVVLTAHDCHSSFISDVDPDLAGAATQSRVCWLSCSSSIPRVGYLKNATYAVGPTEVSIAVYSATATTSSDHSPSGLDGAFSVAATSTLTCGIPGSRAKSNVVSACSTRTRQSMESGTTASIMSNKPTSTLPVAITMAATASSARTGEASPRDGRTLGLAPVYNSAAFAGAGALIGAVLLF